MNEPITSSPDAAVEQLENSDRHPKHDAAVSALQDMFHGSRAMVVIDGASHGNANSAIEALGRMFTNEQAIEVSRLAERLGIHE